MTVQQLTQLASALQGVDSMSPPPKPKARYVFGKAVDAVQKELAVFEKTRKAFMDSYVTHDDQDQPIYLPAETPGMVTFTLREGTADEYAKGWAELHAEMVTLANVRQITRAELSDLPITVAQERTFVACGLVEDAEPA